MAVPSTAEIAVILTFAVKQTSASPNVHPKQRAKPTIVAWSTMVVAVHSTAAPAEKVMHARATSVSAYPIPCVVLGCAERSTTGAMARTHATHAVAASPASTTHAVFLSQHVPLDTAATSAMDAVEC